MANQTQTLVAKAVEIATSSDHSYSSKDDEVVYREQHQQQQQQQQPVVIEDYDSDIDSIDESCEYSQQQHEDEHEQHEQQQQQQQQRRRRVVTFDEYADEWDVMSRHDYSEREIKKCWYSLDDKMKMEERRYKVILRMEAGKSCKRSYQMTYRGLEYLTEVGEAQLEATIGEMVDSIMDEQERQWEQGIDDDDDDDDLEILASISAQCSASCRRKARAVAQQDAIDAQQAWMEDEERQQELQQQRDQQQLDTSGRCQLSRSASRLSLQSGTSSMTDDGLDGSVCGLSVNTRTNIRNRVSNKISDISSIGEIPSFDNGDDNDYDVDEEEEEEDGSDNNDDSPKKKKKKKKKSKKKKNSKNKDKPSTTTSNKKSKSNNKNKKKNKSRSSSTAPPALIETSIDETSDMILCKSKSTSALFKTDNNGSKSTNTFNRSMSWRKQFSSSNLVSPLASPKISPPCIKKDVFAKLSKKLLPFTKTITTTKQKTSRST